MKKILIFTFFLIAFFFFYQDVFAIEIKPPLTWSRSKESSSTVLTSSISLNNNALHLPLDPTQVVFDNGVATPLQNKINVPPGVEWASWPRYSPHICSSSVVEARHIRATFTLNFNPSDVKSVALRSPYYPPTGGIQNIVPVNDHVLIFINYYQIKQIGTLLGAQNLGFDGSAPIANEVDGWIADGTLGPVALIALKSGENQIDFIADEFCKWGGMGRLELVLEVESSAPQVPYFNQTDPPWGPHEYDHATTLNLDCERFGGPTIAACGCALTSAAMLLKFYGVERSPSGDLTNPDTLNNWLKANKGYDFGQVKWTSISSYALKASQKFGTQKIKFIGFGNGPDDFATLNGDLNNGRPPMLEEPNHFIVATGIQGSTYSINDPRWRNRTTLESYSGHFRRMRRFEKTSTDLSTIYISTPSPTELFLTDYQGKRTGRDPTTGAIYDEIPNSFYILEPALVDDSIEEAPPPSENSGVNTLVIINPDPGNFTVEVSSSTGNYDVNFSGYDSDGDISTQAFSQVVPGGQTQEYQLNYSPDPGSQIQVTQIVDIDIKPGSDPNSVNLKSNGVIPVAILTTPSFDATQVDVSTVKFGPNQATEIHNKGHPEDVDDDGDIDLILHFKTQETGFQDADIQACLTGTTLSSVSIQGCDSIKVAGK